MHQLVPETDRWRSGHPIFRSIPNLDAIGIVMYCAIGSSPGGAIGSDETIRAALVCTGVTPVGLDNGRCVSTSIDRIDDCSA